MSTSTLEIDDLVAQFSKLVAPEEDKPTSVLLGSFEEFCRAIFKKLTGNDICPISIDRDNSRININICENCDYIIDNIRSKNIKVIVEELKNRGRELRNQRNTCNDCRKFLFVFDTCYDDAKAERLDNALNALRERLGEKGCGDTFVKLLVLLAAVYAEMIRDEKYVSKAEWFVSLLRAAASTGSSNAYLPLCPSRGDVAMLLYYLAKCQIEKGSDILERVLVEPRHVGEIVLKIAQLPQPEPPAKSK